MKKKNDVYFLVLFTVIVGITLMYMFQSSYAKYRRQTETTVQARVASWNLKVNNEDISSSTTLTNSITPTIDSNPYVKAGTIAPGSSGYFDIIIDATNVDVDFTYTVTGEVDDDTPLEDLIIKNYKVNNGSTTAYNSTTGIVGDIPMNTSRTTIRMYFEWNDSATNTMDNQEDTAYAQEDDYIDTEVNITIHFEQKR
ncbi:MAG: hypothetical protein J6X28_03550 [Bacilli bacterium]|nr:hypothetical protein [Bacilli bacterium]